MKARRFVLASLPLLLAACAGGGPKGEAISFDASGFEGFPSQTLESDVYAEAAFPRNHKRTLGLDLIDKQSIIPIELSVQLRIDNPTSAKILLSAERMDFALYLPDGTVLSPVGADKVARSLKDKYAEKVRAQAFRPGLLEPEARQGYVYFSLAPSKEFGVDGTRIKHATGGVARPMDLTGALLTFNVTIEDRVEPFYVGLQR